MLVASLNLSVGLMTKLVDITYDTLYIGAEVRDLTAKPPIMGFVTHIDAYGWFPDGDEVCYDYYFIIQNCDGRELEFSFDELPVWANLKIVQRDKND